MDIFVASPWGAGMQTNKCAQTFTFDAFVDASLDSSSTLKWKKLRLQSWSQRHRLLCKINIYEALITIDKQTSSGNVAETCRIWLGMLEVPTLCNLAVELVWIWQLLIVGRWKGAFVKMETSLRPQLPCSVCSAFEMYVCQHVNFCRSEHSWFWYHRSRYHDLRYLDQSSSFAALCGC